MDGWEVALLVAAGYVAVVSLVRLMIRRRNQMMTEFHEEVRKEKKRRKAKQRQQDAPRPLKTAG